MFISIRKMIGCSASLLGDTSHPKRRHPAIVFRRVTATTLRKGLATRLPLPSYIAIASPVHRSCSLLRYCAQRHCVQRHHTTTTYFGTDDRSIVLVRLLGRFGQSVVDYLGLPVAVTLCCYFTSNFSHSTYPNGEYASAASIGQHSTYPVAWREVRYQPAIFTAQIHA